jgi:hypothetical protein
MKLGIPIRTPPPHAIRINRKRRRRRKRLIKMILRLLKLRVLASNTFRRATTRFLVVGHRRHVAVRVDFIGVRGSCGLDVAELVGWFVAGGDAFGGGVGRLGGRGLRSGGTEGGAADEAGLFLFAYVAGAERACGGVLRAPLEFAEDRFQAFR